MLVMRPLLCMYTMLHLKEQCSQTWLHIIINRGDLKDPNAQVSPQSHYISLGAQDPAIIMF